MMIMEDSKVSKIEYDLKALMDSRCNKNTCHVESSYLLQLPKYLLLFVNRFRYINNNVNKDRCPIPMDTTVRLSPLNLAYGLL